MPELPPSELPTDAKDEAIAQLAAEFTKSIEFLNWALAMIDDQFAKTGEIGFAESIVWKSAKAFVRGHQEAAAQRLKELKEKPPFVPAKPEAEDWGPPGSGYDELRNRR